MQKLISVGQLIDHSWEYYKKHFLAFMSIASWLLIPAAIGIIALILYPSATSLVSDTDLTFIEGVGIFFWALNTFVITPIIGLWVFISLIRLSYSMITDTPISLHKLPKESWKNIWPFVYVSFLMIAVVAASLLFIAPGLLLSILGGTKEIGLIAGIGTILSVIGILLAVFYGLRWLVYYAFTQYAFVVDNQRGVNALKKSKFYVRGHFLATVVRLILPKIIFLIIALVFESILTFIINTVVGYGVGLDIDLRIRIMSVLSLLAVSLITILFNPLIIIVDTLLFKSLKEMKS